MAGGTTSTREASGRPTRSLIDCCRYASSTPELARIIGAAAADRRRPRPMGRPPSSSGIWLTRLTPALILIDGTQLMILLRRCLARTTLVRGDGISVLLRLLTRTRAILDGRHPLDRAGSRRFWLKGNRGGSWRRRCEPISHARDKVVGLVVRGILKICPRDAEPRFDGREEAVVEIESEGTAQVIPDPSDPLIAELPATAV
jgi:hypothetical protein